MVIWIEVEICLNNLGNDVLHCYSAPNESQYVTYNTHMQILATVYSTLKNIYPFIHLQNTVNHKVRYGANSLTHHFKPLVHWVIQHHMSSFWPDIVPMAHHHHQLSRPLQELLAAWYPPRERIHTYPTNREKNWKIIIDSVVPRRVPKNARSFNNISGPHTVDGRNDAPLDR